MKSIKLALSTFASFTVFCQTAYCAALVTIAVDTGGKTLQDLNGVALTGGVSSINGDGAAVQIGYYTNSSAASPFGSGFDADFVSLIKLKNDAIKLSGELM